MIIVERRGFRCHRHESMLVREGVVESWKWRDPRLAVLVLYLLLNEAVQCTVSARVPQQSSETWSPAPERRIGWAR
jgi:hypothetical protein